MMMFNFYINKEYLKISDIYKIKFNDLDKIEKIYQETNGKWYGVSFNNDKIELKSVEVLAVVIMKLETSLKM